VFGLALTSAARQDADFGGKVSIFGSFASSKLTEFIESTSGSIGGSVVLDGNSALDRDSGTLAARHTLKATEQLLRILPSALITLSNWILRLSSPISNLVVVGV